ncbi:MAG: hypothetical protein EXS36_19595 [Pedosphaera sp.]|nr:hypothetical protein [Pedosphaera sp.]
MGFFIIAVCSKATVLIYDPFACPDGPLPPQSAGLWRAHTRQREFEHRVAGSDAHFSSQLF